MSTITDYKQALDLVPEEALLGSVVWYSISEADVEFTKAKEQLTELGLSTNHLRERLRPVDAFRKATQEVARRRFPHNGDRSTHSRFIVADVNSSGATAYRFLVLERVHTGSDGSKRRVLYEPVAEVAYRKGKLSGGEYRDYGLTVIPKPPKVELSNNEREWMEATLEQLPERFRHHMSHIDSHAVRTFVRKLIYGLGGVCVKENGGVYFVPQVQIESLLKLQGWLADIGSQMHQLPLLDLADQRDMIRDALEDEVITEVDSLGAEIADILSEPSRSVRPKTHKRYVDRAAELLAKCDEYSGLLDRKVDRSRDRVELFKRQVLELTTRVEG